MWVIFILSCSAENTPPSKSPTTQTTKTVGVETPKASQTQTQTKKLNTPSPIDHPTLVPTATPEPQLKLRILPTPSPIKKISTATSLINTPTTTLKVTNVKDQSQSINSSPVSKKPIQTNVSPTVIPRPENTATPIAALTENKFLGPSFTLTLNEEFSFKETDYVISPLQGDQASREQGMFEFEYSGTNIVLYWLPTLGILPEDLLASAYQLLTNSQPENVFTIIGEGTLQLTSEVGRYGAFLINNENTDEAGGGLIAAWTCDISETDFVVTTLGRDSTTLQIRFDRIINGFECEEASKIK